MRGLMLPGCALVLLVLGARGAGARLVCAGTTFCDTVRCQPVNEQACAAHEGHVLPNATLCGCCPACIRLYEVGESCPGDTRRRRPGTKFTWDCVAGAECINNQCTIVQTSTEPMQS